MTLSAAMIQSPSSGCVPMETPSIKVSSARPRVRVQVRQADHGGIRHQKQLDLGPIVAPDQGVGHAQGGQAAL